LLVVVVLATVAAVVSAVVVSEVFGDELLQALNSAAPPARAKRCRRDTKLRSSAPSPSPVALVCSARFVIVVLS